MVENITFEKCCFNLIWPMKILMENSKRKCDGYRQERCHLGESCIEPGLVICCNVIFGWRGLVEDYLGYRVLDSDSSCLALYFFQSENLKESVSESTYVEVDPNGLTSKKQNALECGKCRSTFWVGRGGMAGADPDWAWASTSGEKNLRKVVFYWLIIYLVDIEPWKTQKKENDWNCYLARFALPACCCCWGIWGTNPWGWDLKKDSQHKF